MPIKTIKATINGQIYDLILNTSTGKYEAVINAPSASSFNLSGGYYPVSVTAEDTAGNVTTVDSTHSTLGGNLRLYVKEQVAPVATIIEPSSGAYITTSTPTIRFKIVDNTVQTSGYSGVNKNSCVLKINGSSVSVSSISWEDTDGGYIGTYTPSTAIEDGDCAVSVYCSDNDGNQSLTANCTFKIDTLAPSLMVDMPTDGFETNKSELIVSGTTDDATSKPVFVSINLNGSNVGNVTVNDNGTFTKTITLSQEGENTIEIIATDSAGKSTTVTRKVIYDTTAPVIKSVVISPNPVNAGNTYTITVEVE